MPSKRMIHSAALIFFLVSSGGWFSSSAQNKNPEDKRKLPKLLTTKNATASDGGDIRRNEFAVWGGGSLVTAGISGTSREVKFGILGLRYARVFASGKIAVLKYTIDAIPFALLSYRNKDFVPTAAEVSRQRAHPTVYGVGTAPLGFQINFRPQRRLQPFANFSGGCLYLSAPVPNQLGKQFNFTAELGVGAQILTRSHRAISLGYKLHHISNAGRGTINPGFGSNLFYIGFSVFK
ncbi:MAG: acyloxyacyl hydrolase [Acidobacteria bacterium]|nr:acyloxyacyl hydrolase [Acidobacteriota bacterium]